MSNLPVREMVLYKHGVGFFVRGGAFGGESLTLTFRQDEINDVLKSLAVFDKAGGQVLGIHYPTPMDMQARLASSSIRLPSEASLRGLIADLRGRYAEITFEVPPDSAEDATTQDMFRGRIIGIDEPKDFGRAYDVRALTFVTLVDDEGTVHVIRFERVRGVRILDAQANHDLTYFLDTAVGDDARRAVHVRLSAGDHDLAVYYVAPSPVWRVSYRIVAESDEKRETGKALLQGWGLFDNRLEEDLDNVRVSLVAGQPISFIYDLYSSTIPQRPTVRDEGRIAPGPIEYDADDLTFNEPEFERSGLAKAKSRSVLAMAVGGAPEERARGITMASAGASTPAQATTKDAGEFFQYMVAAPVSVKRGESALVPIISAEVAYTRELLYNRAKLPDHPVAALRFTNTTGLTLERGPVTVVEDGDYKGDAVVPFTRDTGEIYVPYAVELGIKVSEKIRNSEVTRGIHLKDALLVQERFFVTEVAYTLENRTTAVQAVTLETSNVNPDAEPFETRDPDFTSATERRWRIPVPARSQTKFVRKERTLRFSEISLRKLKYEQLREYLAQRWLDQETFDALSELTKTVGELQQADERLQTIAKVRQSIYSAEEHVRANLTTLQATGKESHLRDRVLAQFESLQTQLEDLAAEENQLNASAAQLDARIDAIIAALPQKSS
jgi:hypothetical protein